MRIEGEMTIYRAAELKPLLLQAITSDGELEIDLSGVTELDSSGVQILMLAKQMARGVSCTLRLAHHSAAVVEVFQLLDLAAYFGDPLLVTSSDSSLRH